MQLSFVFLIVFFVFTGCSTFNVVNINNVTEIKGNPSVYCLPKNIIRVKLDLIRTSHQCGPYNRFAKKLLGINNQFTEHTIIWKISGINIENYSVPDTSNVFLVFNNNKNYPTLHFSNEGFIASVNSVPDSTDFLQHNLILNLIREEKQHHLFTDLSIKKIQINRSDTIYKKVRRDSGFVKEPQINTKIVNKNLEEKAEEVANQIFNIREEKVNILTGDYNNSINGQAIKSIIEELDKIEEKYIALFTTIITQDTVSYTFEFIPELNNTKNNILCYFSEVSGISLKPDTSSFPVILDIKRSGGSKSIVEMLNSKTKKKSKKNGFFYRIPELADARILYKFDVVASKKILIAQFGSVLSLPNDLKFNAIEFYKDFGSLKTIK